MRHRKRFAVVPARLAADCYERRAEARFSSTVSSPGFAGQVEYRVAKSVLDKCAQAPKRFPANRIHHARSWRACSSIRLRLREPFDGIVVNAYLARQKGQAILPLRAQISHRLRIDRILAHTHRFLCTVSRCRASNPPGISTLRSYRLEGFLSAFGARGRAKGGAIGGESASGSTAHLAAWAGTSLSGISSPAR